MGSTRRSLSHGIGATGRSRARDVLGPRHDGLAALARPRTQGRARDGRLSTRLKVRLDEPEPLVDAP